MCPSSGRRAGTRSIAVPELCGGGLVTALSTTTATVAHVKQMKSSSSNDFSERAIEKLQSIWLLAVLTRFMPLMLLNPDVLDLIRSFIPNQYIPKFLLDYINAGANWTVTTIWIIAALLISAYAVHHHNQKRLLATLSGLQNRLSAYEDHEPKYDITVSEVEIARTCPCHTQINGLISITPQNAWEGELSNKPFIRCEDNAVAKAFFSGDTDLFIEKYTAGQRSSKVEFPYSITTNGTTTLVFGLKFPLGDENINSSILSKTVPFRIELVYTYYAPALGYPVQNKQMVEFEVDLLGIQKYQR